MNRLLIATHNPAKLEELKIGLKPLEMKGIKLLSLNDVGVEKNPEETGSTFEENSELKARFYANLTRLPTIADDGGLVIPFLDNGPGVKSRRWPGYEASDQELIDYTLLHLKKAEKVQRTAYLETCITFFMPNSITLRQAQGDKTRFKSNANVMVSKPALSNVEGNHDKEILIFEKERIKGKIALKPTGRPTNGYPFRALFIVDKFNKYYDELTETEHDEINHRLIALKRLVKRISNF